MTVEPRRASVSTADAELAVWCWGKDRAPAIVLVHGWADCGTSFASVARLLADDFRILAIDLRGFGESTWPAQGYWFPDYLRDLDALFNSPLVRGPVTLVGHSMGGNVCGLYAGVRPENVARLVLLEGFGLPPSKPGDAPRRYREWLDQEPEAPRWRDFASFDTLLSHLRKLAPRATAPVLEEVAHAWARPHDAGWQLKMDPRHKRMNPVLYRREEAIACWRATLAPVLLVAGDSSDYLSRFRDLNPLTDAASHYANHQTATVADAGHMLHWEQPDAVARLVRSAADMNPRDEA